MNQIKGNARPHLAGFSPWRGIGRNKNEAFELKCMGDDHSFVQGCNQTEAPRTYVRQMWPIYLQVPRTD